MGETVGRTASTDGADGFVPPSPEEIGEHFPQLEVLELLGWGGMGMVYKARQQGLERLVALKILRPGLSADPAFAERFAREARSMARLSHSNIVTIFNFGETGGLYYFIMEYVDGVSLREMQAAQRLSPQEALALVPPICEALQYAHDEGIIHRDVKPENILVDRKGRVRIADFGLAKLLQKANRDLTLTRARQVIGTPNYMAPEQIERPLEVDQRADIYSLGVVLYEMLTGELPIGRFAPPSQKVEVDVRLDDVVLRTLEKEPDRRYQQVSEVKTDVQAITHVPQPSPQAAPSRRSALWLLAGALAGAAAAVLPALLGPRSGPAPASRRSEPKLAPREEALPEAYRILKYRQLAIDNYNYDPLLNWLASHQLAHTDEHKRMKLLKELLGLAKSGMASATEEHPIVLRLPLDGQTMAVWAAGRNEYRCRPGDWADGAVDLSKVAPRGVLQIIVLLLRRRPPRDPDLLGRVRLAVRVFIEEYEQQGLEPSLAERLGLSALSHAARPTGEGWAGFIPVPDPLYGKNPTHPLIARKAPGPGESFLDGRFRTRLTRVTKQKRLRHEHPGHDPFNKDRSLIALYDSDSGEYQVFRTRPLPYDQSANRVQALEIAKPRWDGEDPDVIWGFDGLKIVTANLRTRQPAVVKDFAKDAAIAPMLKGDSSHYRITTGGEGESSRDKQFWALMLQDTRQDDRARCLFTWDRRTDRVLGVRKLEPDEDIDWVGMSWKGGWVLINAEPGSGRLSGLMMADKELTRFHKLAHNGGIADVGLDVDGNEVIVMQNSRTDYIDLVPIDWKTTPVAEGAGEYANTNRTRLVRLFYSSESGQAFHGDVHLSCNFPGYCVVSTSTKPKVREQNWLDRSIILVRLDPRQPRAYYLAKVHGTGGTYLEETQATIASDGTGVLWASNWNEDVGTGEVFLIQLAMPKDWRRLLK